MKNRAPLLLGAALLAACGDESSAPTAPTPAARTCGVSTASRTPVDRARFPLGATFWLPAGSWTLASSPAGNQNALFTDAASQRMAFVPHVAGAHRFTSSDGRAVTLGAVSPASLAFQNHNYFPTRAVAADGDRLWVAAVLRPELIEVSRATLTPTATIPVGSWPVAVAAAGGRVVVAARGDDSLTVVDAATRRPVRSVWVGYEVSNVAVTPDGATAIALAPTDRKVVFVDLAAGRVVGSVDVGIDPAHLALSADGARAWVAGRRTGNPGADPARDPAGDDLSEIDVARRAVVRSVRDVGATLGGLAVSPDGARLYVTGVRADSAMSLADMSARPFRHVVVEYDLTGMAIREARVAELTPGDGADPPIGPRDVPGGDRELAVRRPVSLQAVAVAGDALWVVSEAADMVLRLARDTLRETGRSEARGRPRALAVADGTAYVYGHQALTLTAVTAAGAATSSMPLATDPRPEAVAFGQRFFTGTGVRVMGAQVAGDRWSCNTCHADALSDRVVWQAGPNRMHRNASRPFTQLEGTFPLGWQGYLSDVRNYAYTVTTNVGLYQPTQAQVDGLAAYLASLAPPPAANSLTDRDGGHSAEGCEGAAVFTRACGSCHGGPLTTNRGRIEESLGDNTRADTPSLVGSYRNGTWFRKNTAASLRDAVEQMATWSRRSLSAAELTSLTRYVGELTGRDFYLAVEAPRRTARLPADAPVVLTFSMPVHVAADNLARVRLLDANGAALGARVTAEGRFVTVTPTSALPFDAPVRVEVGDGFEAQGEVRTVGATRVEYRTVARPALRLDGTYRLDLTGVPPFAGTAPGAQLYVDVATRTSAGGAVSLEVSSPSSQYRFRATGSVSGRRMTLPPIPVPVGPATADGFSGFAADLTDADNDGVADGVTAPEGFTLAGPGFEFLGLTWSMRRMP